MKTFLKYFITLLGGFALGILSIALVFGVLISGFSSKIGDSATEELTEASILTMTLEGDIAERSTSNPLANCYRPVAMPNHPSDSTTSSMD